MGNMELWSGLHEGQIMVESDKMHHCQQKVPLFTSAIHNRTQ